MAEIVLFINKVQVNTPFLPSPPQQTASCSRESLAVYNSARNSHKPCREGHVQLRPSLSHLLNQVQTLKGSPPRGFASILYMPQSLMHQHPRTAVIPNYYASHRFCALSLRYSVRPHALQSITVSPNRFLRLRDGHYVSAWWRALANL